MKKILSNRIYMTVLASDMISNFGDVMYYLALMNYVLLLPDTELALSLISLSEILPIFASLLTGYLSDRTPDKVKVIKWTQLFRFVLYLVVGLVMSFTPALWIVVVVSIINVFSDFAGQYESGLYIPLSLRIISNEDRETSMAFRQTVVAFLNIIFQAVAAVLVGWFSYSHLAFLNAGTFLVAFLVMTSLTPALSALLKTNPIKVEAKKEEKKEGLISGLWQSIKLALKEMNRIPELKMSMVIVPVINAIFAIMSTVGILMMSNYKDFVVVNSAITIATLTISLTVGNILGSILTMNLFKNTTIKTFLRFGCLGMVFIWLSLYFRQPYLMMISLFVEGIVVGGINPKFGALIYNNLPEESLATIDGGISTYFQMGVVVARFVLSLLILLVTAQQVALIFLVLSLLIFLYSLKPM